VSYHFATISEEQRDDVEAHLVECSECLRAFLSVKRAIETGQAGPMPSAVSRQRLRSDIQSELRKRHERPWKWWERPLAMACAASVLVASTAAMRAVTSGPGTPPHSMAGAGR
jgi:anti-sigma factor RsiW